MIPRTISSHPHTQKRYATHEVVEHFYVKENCQTRYYPSTQFPQKLHLFADKYVNMSILGAKHPICSDIKNVGGWVASLLNVVRQTVCYNME